jgi:hypothetical protein
MESALAVVMVRGNFRDVLFVLLRLFQGWWDVGSKHKDIDREYSHRIHGGALNVGVSYRQMDRGSQSKT